MSDVVPTYNSKMALLTIKFCPSLTTANAPDLGVWMLNGQLLFVMAFTANGASGTLYTLLMMLDKSAKIHVAI